MRSRWQQGASPSSAKERAPSSVTGGLEETGRTLKTPALEGGLDGWDGHRLSQAGSALPWAQRPALVSPWSRTRYSSLFFNFPFRLTNCAE